MTRYLRQNDAYSCGPHAIINALKWAGNSASKQSLFNQLKKDGNVVSRGPYRGMFIDDFDFLIHFFSKKKKFKLKGNARYHQPYIDDVDAHLAKGGAILLKFLWDTKDHSHYALLVGKQNDRYVGVNFFKNKTVSLVKRRRLVKLLRKTKTFEETENECIVKFNLTSIAWFLEKV